MSLPDFFKNKINCFNVDECLGIGDFKIQQKYDETINSLVNRSNDFDCNYFISLISKKKPFHYLKYTHNFWDDLTRFAIKEYSLKDHRKRLTVFWRAILFLRIDLFSFGIIEMLGGSRLAV